MWPAHALVLALSLLLTACGGSGGSGTNASPAPAAPAAPVGPAQLSTLRSDLANPWALAALPDGRWLLTERTGKLWLLAADARSRTELSGLPAVASAGQGGLLDVAVDPDFSQGQPFVYWSYSEPGIGGTAGTAVARARLEGNQLGTPAQDLQQTLGKVVRIQRDGSVPADNPSFAQPALPGIWSLGHRNPQGAALHPGTGELWVSEHGPQGGDEINIARAGRNYGWPTKSYGCEYGAPVGDACRIGGGTHAPQFEEPLSYWVPTSIAPSNFVFYDGAMFPEWRGQVLMGALAGQALWRLELSGNAVAARSTVFSGERIRDVDIASDGALWMLADSGKLLRYGR